MNYNTESFYSKTKKSNSKVIRISVITAVKNGERFIRQTIESVLSQKGDFELEYIIRDGCSTDRTLEIIKEYGNKIILVSKKDGSPQEAINAGMNMATGDIGCWLNADDIFLPGALQKVIDLFHEHPDKDWSYGRCKIIDDNNREIRKPITWYKNILGYFYSRNVLLCENYINQPATFWKMSLWKDVNGSLNKKYKAAWDYELWLKMAKASKAIHIRDYLASFRRTQGTISETHFEKQFNEELEIAKEHGNKLHYYIHYFTKNKILIAYKILAGKKKISADISDLHTFVIPAYKESHYLENCIQSLLNQKVKSLIIIATSTPSIFLENISKKYKIPLYVNEKQNGIASDWNFALSNCKTQYCTIAHQDDIYYPEYSLKVVQSLHKDNNSIICFTGCDEINTNGVYNFLPYLVVKKILLWPFYIRRSWSSKFIKKLILVFGCSISCPSVTYNLAQLNNFSFTSKYKTGRINLSAKN